MMMNNYPDMHTLGNRNCIPQETVIRNVQLAHAYVPFQKMCSTFEPIMGLRKGTIFPELLNVYSLKGERSYK